MDLPPPVQGPETGHQPVPPAGAAPPQAPDGSGSAHAGELEWRLSQLEAGLRHIDQRLDRLEESMSRAVTEGVEGMARDLRRTVSELGRRLVLELPQVLAKHRDEIVAELRPPPPPDPGPAGDDPAGDDEVGVEPDVPAPADEADAAAVAAGPAKRRRRVHGLRQRGG